MNGTDPSYNFIGIQGSFPLSGWIAGGYIHLWLVVLVNWDSANSANEMTKNGQQYRLQLEHNSKNGKKNTILGPEHILVENRGMVSRELLPLSFTGR